MVILFPFISIDQSKFLKLKILTFLLPILLFSLLHNVYGNEDDRALQTQLALRFHRAKELTPPSFMKRNWNGKYYDGRNIFYGQLFLKNACHLDEFRYHIICKAYFTKVK
uniref:SXP/RAL-2 family protein Ani s 5-like cation-binding domain-containing protein n=1 Tax=Strongyloides stercoralis TaxID=6248 RepID=A0A0K0E193_STRER